MMSSARSSERLCLLMILSSDFSAEAGKQNNAVTEKGPQFRREVNEDALCAAYLWPYSPPQFLTRRLFDARQQNEEECEEGCAGLFRRARHIDHIEVVADQLWMRGRNFYCGS